MDATDAERPAAQRSAGAMTVRRRTAAVTWALSLLSVVAQAQTERDPVLDLLPEGAGDLDPIGVGDTASLRDVPLPTREEPAPDPTLGPEPPAVEAQRGQVLWAIPGVRELEHRVDVRLVDGLALVQEELAFGSRARHRAEVRYRLAVPPGAAAVSLEVCRAGRCRQAVPDASDAYFDALRAAPEDERTPAPIAHVARERDALVVRAAPVEQGPPTVVRLQWVAPAPLRGGVARLRLPARGSDPRAAPMTVTLSADDLLAPSLQGAPAGGAPVRVDPWEDLEVAAIAPGGGRSVDVARFRCGQRRCARVRVWAGPRPPRRDDYVLLVDVSPSTFGPARGRLGPALAALVATMPSRSTVRAVAFAGRAEALVSEAVPPGELPLAAIARARETDLGAATRFDAALDAMRGWGSGLHAIVVGDGGLTTGPELQRATDEAERLGLRLSVLNLGDRATSPALKALAARLGGAVVEAKDAAEEAARGHSSQRLEEALLPILAPPAARRVEVRVGRRRHVLGPLWSGEELTWTGPLEGRLAVVVDGRRERPERGRRGAPFWEALGQALTGPTALAAVHPADRGAPSRPDCHPRGPSTRAGGVSSAAAPVVPAEPLGCGPLATEEPRTEAQRYGRGVPAETLLQMLRARIVPVARRCFRRDRAGRPDYATRAVFRFRLRDREVAEADVEGAIPPALRACLRAAVDTLDVPYFEGTVNVRYPLYTERAEEEPRVELAREVLDVVDRAVGDEPTQPPEP